MRVRQMIEPVYDKNSKILILGSFPSIKSREAGFFYQHPRNRFWQVIGTITGTTEYSTIEQQKNMLLKNNIAVWDVIESCDIKGSSDSSIKEVLPADIFRILESAKIQKIFANGEKSYKLYMKYIYKKDCIEIIKLPSTSPANAKYNLNMLIDEWKIIKT